MRSLEDLLGPEVWKGVEEAARLASDTPQPPELLGWPVFCMGRPEGWE